MRRYKPKCPRCARNGRTTVLDGGPTVFWCEHGHGATAADVDATNGEVTAR